MRPDYIPSHSPDGLSFDDITALQREVTDELRREGHLPAPRRRHRRAATSRPRNPAPAQHARAPRDPAPGRDQHREEHR